MNTNDLLLWLSAKGSGSWSRFRAAVDELQVPDESIDEDHDPRDVPNNQDRPVHSRLRWNLERLGHVEFFREEFPNGWRVVPPTLACATNLDGAVGILCGARTDKLLTRIKDAAARLRICQSSQPECPDRIEIVATRWLGQAAHFRARLRAIGMPPRARISNCKATQVWKQERRGPRKERNRVNMGAASLTTGANQHQ